MDLRQEKSTLAMPSLHGVAAGKELFILPTILEARPSLTSLAWAGSSTTVACATPVGPLRAIAVIPWLSRELN